MPLRVIITGTLIFLLLLMGCKSIQNRQDQPAIPLPVTDEQLMDVNRYLVSRDVDSIRAYTRLKGWEMTETGTGLFYQILERRTGYRSESPLKTGDQVKMSYEIRFLDGKLVYSSRESGPRVFIVDQSESEPGLHEVARFLVPGDSARIIVPPHLGFGLVGDGDRVPARSILVYSVRVTGVIRSSDR